MAINLKDIPAAVKAYLDTKVTVTVSTPVPSSGTTIGPNETFTFSVVAANADAANGGVVLKNMKYRLAVDNPAVAKIKVPTGGTATDLAGNSLVAGAEVGAFIFAPTSFGFDLPVGDTDRLSFTGKAGSNQSGGTTTIQARVLADIDLDQLFPKGEDTPSSVKTLIVTG